MRTYRRVVALQVLLQGCLQGVLVGALCDDDGYAMCAYLCFDCAFCLFLSVCGTWCMPSVCHISVPTLCLRMMRSAGPLGWSPWDGGVGWGGTGLGGTRRDRHTNTHLTKQYLIDEDASSGVG